MEIVHLYMYGQTYEIWKKHDNHAELFEDLKKNRCDEIYIEIFTEEYGFKEIKRLDAKELEDMILNSKDDDKLILKGPFKGSDKHFEQLQDFHYIPFLLQDNRNRNENRLR